MPLAAGQVDVTIPFRSEELLYRRVSKSEIGPAGEIDPSGIEAVTFKAQVQTAPSVMRSAFSQPQDVLHFSCARRDTTDWSVFSILVNALPSNLMAGDGRAFRFFPVHIPEPDCGVFTRLPWSSKFAEQLCDDLPVFSKTPCKNAKNAIKEKSSN